MRLKHKKTKHLGQIHINCALEKENQSSFSPSVRKIIFMNMCPTSEVYRLGSVSLVPKYQIKQKLLLLLVSFAFFF